MKRLYGIISKVSKMGAEVEDCRLQVKGGFRLKEIDGRFPGGRKTLVTSMGGMKWGVLMIGTKSLVFKQRLSTAGFILSALLSLIPSVVLSVAVVSLISDPHKPASGSMTGALVLLVMMGTLIPPLLIALRVRRFKRTFLLADVIKSGLRETELELHIQPCATAASPATPSPPATGSMAPSVFQLDFKLFKPDELPTMTKILSASGIELKDASSEEKAGFARQLQTATPKVWVTPLLIALNVIVFLALSVNSETMLGAPLPVLLKWGADFGPLTVNDQQWWRLLSCCFLHLGILHLLFNMYALLLAGKLTERLFGNWLFLLIYLGCGLTSSLTSLWFNPMSVSVGASGAIFGVYGAMLGYFAREGGALPKSVVAPVANSAIILIIWNLVYGFLNLVNNSANQIINSTNAGQSHGTMIDLAAHAGGLLAGLIFGLLGARPLETGRRRSLAPGRTLVLALGIGSIMALLFIPVLKVNQLNIARMTLLGGMYYRGEGVAKNPATSVRWWGQAAEQGDLGSQKLLGFMYYRGDGVDQDAGLALQWFIKAGEQGDADAAKAVAGIYLRGEGVPTNTIEGINWLTKIADRGDVEVQKMLAAIYFTGDGVEKDIPEAVKWARAVADQGDSQYQTMLGNMYYQGDGVPQNKSEAAHWYRLAANQGNANAQTMFGVMCANGEGVEKNPGEALKWLTLSGDNRIQVDKLRQNLELNMSTDQIQAVRLAVKKFLRLHASRQPQ